MNKHPLTPVTEQDADAYARDGAVCLRNIFDQDWIKVLKEETVRIAGDPLAAGLLPHGGDKHMCRVSDVFRHYIFESPAAEATAHALRSREVRFFYDQLFLKEPVAAPSTYWHTDIGGWPVSGGMTPSVWMPLTPVRKHYSLEVLAGSHLDQQPWWNITRNSKWMTRPADRPLFPDFEERRDDPSLTFLAWDMDPGDLLIVHPGAFHYSSGNPAEETRMALSTRWFGDDIRWAPRPDCVNHPGISFDEMITGQKPEGDLFPLVWSEDGRRDSPDALPRGFAARWSRDPADYQAKDRALVSTKDTIYGNRLVENYA